MFALAYLFFSSVKNNNYNYDDDDDDDDVKKHSVALCSIHSEQTRLSQPTREKSKNNSDTIQNKHKKTQSCFPALGVTTSLVCLVPISLALLMS